MFGRAIWMLLSHEWFEVTVAMFDEVADLRKMSRHGGVDGEEAQPAVAWSTNGPQRHVRVILGMISPR